MEIEDMNDDFGELYADVKEQIKEEDVKPKGKDTDSGSDSDGFDDSNEKGGDATETVMEEEGKVEEEEDLNNLDNGSDSEDDLKIVLNEEDAGETMAAPKRVVPYSFECDEEEELGFGMDKDRKRVDVGGGDGLEQGGGEGGNFMKGVYHSSQHLQYKYIRPQATTFPCNSKTNGFGAAVSSLSSFRGEWDSNGFSQRKGSSSGFIGSYSQSGCDFFLTRNRAIFDVNIDMFEKKPWKHPGVDITDFFNFGFDEESWKHYCNEMERFRQQVTLRPNQAYGSEVVRQTVGSEAVDGETTQTEQDIPQGRAIEVEGGVGERRSSMDIRRPRNRDSDVVIQIAVQDSAELSSDSSKEEQGSLEGSKLDVSERGSSGIKINSDELFVDSKDGDRRSFKGHSVNRMKTCSLRRCSGLEAASDALNRGPHGQANAAVDGRPHWRAKEHVNEESEALETVDIMKESSRDDQIQLSSSLSYPDGHVEASNAKADLGDEKTLKPGKRKSLNSGSGERVSLTSGSHHSKDSGSSDCKTDLRGNKDNLGNQSYMGEEKDYCSRPRLRSVAEPKIHTGDDRGSRRSSRKDWHDENHSRKSRSKRKRKNEYDCYDEEDLAYYRETEESLGFCNERFAEIPYRDAYSDDFCGKGRIRCRDEMDPYDRQDWDEREYFLERGIRHNEVEQREHYLHEEYDDRGMIGFAHGESPHIASEDSCFYTDNERHHWQRRKRRNEQWLRRRTKIDDFVLEHEYREEYIQGNHGRDVTYNNREMEYHRERYDRRLSNRYPDRRDRYGGSPSLDLLSNSRQSVVYDDEYCEYPDQESFLSREFHVTDRRGWRDITSPRNFRRSDEEDVGRWRETHPDNHRNSGWFDPTWDDYNPDEVIYPDDDFCIDKRRHTRQPKAFGCPDDKISTRYWNRGRIFAEETSFSYKQGSRPQPNKQNLTHGRIFLDKYRLERNRKRIVRQEIGGSIFNTRITSNLEIIEKGKVEQAGLRCRGSVDLHLVEWEGKASGRCSEAVDMQSAKSINHVVEKGQKNCRLSDKLHPRKMTTPHTLEVKTNSIKGISSRGEEAKECDSKHSFGQSNPSTLHHEPLEEGQLSVEEAEKVSPTGTSKKKLTSQDVANENKIGGGYDNKRIMETMAKMEKRRERFKELVTTKEPDKNPKSELLEPDVAVETTTEVNQQRPSRKRRWGGS